MPVRKTWRSLTKRLLRFQSSEYKFVEILIALCGLILFSPLLPDTRLGGYVLEVFLAFVVLSGVVVTRDERSITRQIIIIGSITLLLDWVESFLIGGNTALLVLDYALYGLFFGVVAISIILQMTRAERVTINIICGAIAAYLLVGIAAVFLAMILETMQPGSFNFSTVDILDRRDLFNTLLYFVFISLSTMGYGDITPISPAARSLAIALGVSGQMYLTVLLAMLVGKFLSHTSS